MKTITGLICFSLIMALIIPMQLAKSAEVTLGWEANSESDLEGYKIHYGNITRDYNTKIDVGNRTSFTIGGLEDGKEYYFAATAYDTAGNESPYSNEVSYDVPIPDTTPPLSPTIIINIFQE